MQRLELDRCTELIIDHRGKTPKKLATDFEDSGVPVASALLVHDGILDLTGARFVSEATFEQWMPEKTRRNDVLLTSEAPLGRVALVPDDSPLVLGQRLFCLRGRSDVLDSRFLYYALQSPTVMVDLASRATGTTVFGISQAALRRVRVPVPSMPRQQAIAEVLGALDDKIALNTAILAKTLALGTAITRQHVEGGVLSAVAAVADFHNRKRIPLSAKERGERRGAIPYWGANGQLDTVDEALFDEPLVLVGEDGSVMTSSGTAVVHHVWGPSWVNNHAHVLTGKGVSTEFLYFVMKDLEVVSAVTGAVQPKLSMGNLKTLQVRIPAPDRLPRLQEQLGSLLAYYRSVSDESRILRQLRDTLLPALMDGRLRVRDVITRAEEYL